MNKEELIKKFNENVVYLSQIIPPDDIYSFAEQTFMAACYFLHKWGEVYDLNKEMSECEVSRIWITNILSLLEAQQKKMDINLDLKLGIED